jgi:hypothetical protein
MKRRLKVSTAGKRHYISVPVGRAGDLHAYLRGHHVHSSPPEPDSTGFGNIELHAAIDVKAVQRLLDSWA